MTVVHTNYDYLEDEYLEAGPYLTSHVLGNMGWQAQFVINDAKFIGQQVEAFINKQKPIGQQVEAFINDCETPLGFQTEFLIFDQKEIGMQVEGTINNVTPFGAQTEFAIEEVKPIGFQALLQINEDKSIGMQVEAFVNQETPVGMQTQFIFPDVDKTVGFQSEFTVEFDKSIGQQVEAFIQPEYPEGMQTEFTFPDVPIPVGMQTQFIFPNTLEATGQQFEAFIQPKDSNGFQFEGHIIDHETPMGMEVTISTFAHWVCERYLYDSYLVEPYLAGCFHAQGAFQVEFQNANTLKEIGMQVEAFINEETPIGQQAEFFIEKEVAKGIQAELTIFNEFPVGMQIEAFIENEIPYGQQTEFTILDDLPVGMQVEAKRTLALAMQVLATLYNTTNLRILCEFPPRGTGANAGTNWTANSTEPGEYDVNNVNTDLVEQYWRSEAGDLTGINLDCDTGLPQGVFLDTLALLNHNFTGGATVTLIGSTLPDYSVIGFQKVLQITQDNIYYIAEDLPIVGYRYWRISVDDATNPDDFLQVGTTVFGAAKIFQGECFTDEVELEMKDLADRVNTEGFTNVSNSRAQKKVVRLDFRSLEYSRRNYRIIRELFLMYRTVLKCLWIPTPDITDQENTARFAVFAKMAAIPVERHNHKGHDADYVSFTVGIDESL